MENNYYFCALKMTYYRIIDQLDVEGEELTALIENLPSWRREGALRFKFESGRRECAMSYLLLCDMLREHFGITEQPQFALGEHGKPRLVFGNALSNTAPLPMGEGQDEAPHIHFNLSHCKNAVACIISDEGEVGIDVECLGRYKPSLAEYCMNEGELQSIADASDPDLEFTRLWTQKEALLKYTGEGIVDDMKHVLDSPRTLDITFEKTENKAKGYVCTMAKNRN